MSKQNLNIPATLIHEVNGKQYKVPGILLQINESNDTCSMKFKDGYKTSNIPMSKIMISEGFIDKIKEYGKKITNYVVEKIRGFVALIDEATGLIESWSINNIANVAVQAAKGKLPNGIYFAPSESCKQLAGVGGMNIDQAFAEAEENDRNHIVDYWTRVINRTGKNPDETIAESVKYVNEHYYKNSKAFDKSLNEKAIFDLGDFKDENGDNMMFVEVNSKKLHSMLKRNIRNQISGPLGGHADEKPLLIWGAPGIGKTAIIKGVIKDFANAKFKAINLNLITIGLHGYTLENWTLPDMNSEHMTRKDFSDTPKAWIPVYEVSPNQEENKQRDYFINTCRHLTSDGSAPVSSDNRGYEGGIVFMDEYTRCEQSAESRIMNLINEHKFGDNYQVGSKWGFVFAANRAVDEYVPDEAKENTKYIRPGAQNRRFQDVLFVPSREEWLDWARSINPITGEANVPPFICEFIEASPEHVWYSTVKNGGYDDLLDNKESDKKASTPDEVQSVYDQDKLTYTSRMVTPATWGDSVTTAYRRALIDMFDREDSDESGEEIYAKLVKKSTVEKKNEDGESYKDYYGGILPTILKDEMNELSEEAWDDWCEEYDVDEVPNEGGLWGRYSVFMKWVGEYIHDIVKDTKGNAETSTSPIMQEWRNYNAYKKVFTDNVLNSIWETGKMPDMYQEDDDFYSRNMAGYGGRETTKWKQYTPILQQVADLVADSYPGDIEKDAKADAKALANSNPDAMSDEEVIEKAQQYNQQYSFSLGNRKSVNVLFTANVMKKVHILRIFVNILDNSIVARKLVNAITWMAKIVLQTKCGNIMNVFTDNLVSLVENGITDGKVKDILLNIQNSQKAQTEANAHPGDKKYITKAAIESTKNVCSLLSLISNNVLKDSTDSLKQ